MEVRAVGQGFDYELIVLKLITQGLFQRPPPFRGFRHGALLPHFVCGSQGESGQIASRALMLLELRFKLMP